MNSPTLLPLGVFGLGGTELVVILVILLVLFGGSKLPSLARGLGQSIKEFKKSSKDDDDSDEKKVVATPAAPAAKPTATPVSKDPGSN